MKNVPSSWPEPDPACANDASAMGTDSVSWQVVCPIRCKAPPPPWRHPELGLPRWVGLEWGEDMYPLCILYVFDYAQFEGVHEGVTLAASLWRSPTGQLAWFWRFPPDAICKRFGILKTPDRLDELLYEQDPSMTEEMLEDVIKAFPILGLSLPSGWEA